MDHQFVVVWDCYGLECVFDITKATGEKVWATLKGDKNPVAMPNLMHLELRARYNSQRHYEIYIFNAVEGITADDIRELFESNPQHAADTIRRIGHCYYSDRRQDHNVKIT